MQSKPFPLVDFHTHAFPDAIAARTMTKLSAIANAVPYTDGTLSGLRAKQEEDGVTLTVIHQIATKPSQQITVNNWAAANQKDRIVFFGSVYPGAEDALPELSRIKEIGLKGIKFHPDYQEFFVEDERFFPIYQEIEQLSLPMIFHAGRDPFSPDLVHATPKGISKVAKAFPNLTIIAAHLGGMERCDEVEEYLVGLPNVYFDLSMAHTFADPIQAERIVKTHGTKKILFASDLPWGTAKQTLAFMDQLHLSEDERKQICYQNAYRILGID